ncbi:class I adenylate-forming enzyme family protein [Paenibacillus sp. SI8]|uniref:class I adenylate-forming enzyme family protein n=1 Tax=unclassified Paenibacillus TaxID=185978 RepID=UPI0034651B6A
MDASSLTSFFRETARDDRGFYFADSSLGEKPFISYAAMFEQAQQIAGSLKSLGLRHRFLAAIWMDQTPDCFQAFIAVVLAGGVPVPLHAAAKWEEVREVIHKVEAEALLTSPHRFLHVEPVLRSNVSTRFIDGATGKLLESDYGDIPLSRRYVPPEETAVLFMTSGTTGEPKGIMLSDLNLLTNASAIQEYLNLDSTDNILLSKSFGYCSTHTSEWFVALIAGANLFIPASIPHPLYFVKYIRDSEITFMCTVPSVVIPLIRSESQPLTNLTSLKKIIIVGGQMPPNLLLRLQEQMPWALISPGYGLTEASPRVSYLPPSDLRSRPDSVGIPISGVSISIYREGQPVGRDEVGEVVVNGPGVMLGYYEDHTRTDAVLQHYGLRTADIGYLDKEDYLYVQGRSDNALNVGGNMVYPEAIEKILVTHPSVKEVAVTGRPNPVWGQLPLAFVVLEISKASVEITKDELYKFCQKRFSGAQRPADIVIVEKLPKTRSEKINRDLLKLMARETAHVD